MQNPTTGQHTPQTTEAVFWQQMAQITANSNRDHAKQANCDHIVAYGEICIKCGKDMWG